MDIYNDIHTVTPTDDVYDNVIYSIHKRGKQKTIPYTLIRRQLTSDLIDMSYDGLHYIKCHVTLPKISCIENYKIGWDYDAVIKSLNIKFNNVMIENRYWMVDDEIKFAKTIDAHTFSFIIPTFYSSVHSYFPLYMCHSNDQFTHGISYELSIKKLIKLKNIEVNTLCSYHDNVIVCDSDAIPMPMLEAWYVQLEDDIKQDTQAPYIVERAVEFSSETQQYNFDLDSTVTKIKWWNVCNWTTLNLNGVDVLQKADAVCTRVGSHHVYQFSLVEDTRKHSNSKVLKNSFIEFDKSYNTHFQLFEAVKLEFTPMSTITKFRIIK